MPLNGWVEQHGLGRSNHEEKVLNYSAKWGIISRNCSSCNYETLPNSKQEQNEGENSAEYSPTLLLFAPWVQILVQWGVYLWQVQQAKLQMNRHHSFQLVDKFSGIQDPSNQLFLWLGWKHVSCQNHCLRLV